MKTRKRYSAQFKAELVLELLKEEKSLSELASEHAIHPNQLRDWRRVALEGLPQLFERTAQQQQVERAAYEQQIDKLYTEIGRLSSQLSWLQKKLVTTVARAERLAMVEYETRMLPLTVQAELLGLSRASLYYQPVAPSVAEIALKHRIDELYTAHPFYGSRRITAALRREGHLINRKQVQRHMREMGIAAIHPGPNLSKRRQAQQVYPYLLRGLAITDPNQVWGIRLYRK